MFKETIKIKFNNLNSLTKDNLKIIK